jgi:hypothetical protein
MLVRVRCIERLCTARGRSSLIPWVSPWVSPRWRATLCAGARWRAILRAGESMDCSNPAAREPLRVGESTHLRSQRTPGGCLARGTPSSSPPGMRLTRRLLSRGWGTFHGPMGGWTGCRACSEPRSDPLGPASTAWAGPPFPWVQCSAQESDCRCPPRNVNCENEKRNASATRCPS